MPVKKSPPSIDMIDLESGYSSTLTQMTNSKMFYVVVILLIIAALAFYKKEWFVAGTVNNRPVTNFELLSRMNSQYRQKTLDQLIDEKIITDEAKKKGIVVTDEDVDNKIKELETGYGGAQVFDSLLEQEGLTRESIKSQIKSSLILEKLYSNEITITDEEVAQFIETNSALLQGTDSAKQMEEARNMIKEQKAGQLYREKFQQLKDAAQIKKF